MNRIIIYDYSPSLTDRFSGEELIPRVTRIEDVEPAYYSARMVNTVFCVWLDAPLMSLSDLRLEALNESIPIVAHVYSLGDIFRLLSSIDTLRRLSLRVFFSSSCDENFSSIKLLSSLGVDTGLLFDALHIDDERFLDLASYSLLGQVPHASIEPFDYIWRNIQQDKNLDFDTVFFVNPQKYIYANENLDFSLTRQDLQDKRYIGNLNQIKEIDFDTETKFKFDGYYNHFFTLDSCSKCPSFKVCNKASQDMFKNCQVVFASVFEYAEIRDGLERQNNNPKVLCQL